MVAVSLEEQILEGIRRLNDEQKRRVLEYTRSLSIRPKGTPGKVFLERTADIYIDPADLETMQRVIEEDLERINLDDWNLPA